MRRRAPPTCGDVIERRPTFGARLPLPAHAPESHARVAPENEPSKEATGGGAVSPSAADAVRPASASLRGPASSLIVSTRRKGRST